MLRMAILWDMGPSRPQSTIVPGLMRSIILLSFLVTVSGLPVMIWTVY